MAERLLLATGRLHDVVANEIEQPADFEAGRWKNFDESGRERTVNPVTVERGSPSLAA
jgi:hypothetical protein